MPPGFEDILAVENGCHPNFVDTPTMAPHPTDPDLYIIESKRPIGLPARMVWKPFDSDDV